MRFVRSFLFTGAVCLIPATLRAQRAAPAADTTALSTYSIPVQPLRAALAQYSLQSGLRVHFAEDLGAIRTVLLTGTYAGSVALRAMLAGTGLHIRFTSASQAEVYAPGDMPVYALPPMSVTADRGRTYVTHSTRSAMKTDTPLRDTPQSVSIVTSDAIRDQGMQGMADVARYLPGVQMGQGEGHRDAPTIRGNSSTADFFIDGVRDDAQYFRDLYNVERVEALKGANALIFGRGGAGGVINRVIKQPQERAVRDAAISAGSYDHRRITADLGNVLPMLTDRAGVGAWRVNGMYENSGGFRQDASVKRFGINPSLSLTGGESTRLLIAYERFGEDRNVDRGVPSFQGNPFGAPITAFFGNADSSYATTRVHGLSALVERKATTSVKLRNRFQATSYDKFYQNSFASGAVNAAGTQVNLAAYNNDTDRRNIIDQLEATFELTTGGLRHTALAGVEGAHQHTRNFRNTGYYDNTTTSLTVDASTPATDRPITFRQSPTDADNETTALVGALYVQDGVTISDMVQVVAGVRFENFDIDFTNRRTDETLSRTDRMMSPRAGLIFKPLNAASLYGSYSVSHLPSSGDQFSSLTVTTQTLEPERITNYEVGAKWDARPGLSLTAAVYRLERTKTTAPDLVDAARTVQTGAQRTSGYELGAAGAVTSWWQVTGGAAFQRARITSTTRAAPAGATVPLVPERTASLWNRWKISNQLGIGAGVVHRSDMYAATDNTVKLPGYTRADAAVYMRAASRVRLQLNVENVLNERYYATSNGNNNIMPGSPRSLRLTVATQR